MPIDLCFQINSVQNKDLFIQFKFKSFNQTNDKMYNQNAQTLLFMVNKKINRMLHADWFYHREKYLNPIVQKLTKLKKYILDKQFLDSSFEQTSQLNSFKLHILRKTKKTEELISTIDDTTTITKSSFISFKKCPASNQKDVEISNESTSEDILKKKILSNLKQLCAKFQQYQILVDSLKKVNIKTEPQIQLQSEFINLSLIDLWNQHLEKFQIIETKASQCTDTELAIVHLKKFVEQNQQPQLKDSLQNYKLWEAACLKIIVNLIREMKKLINSEESHSFNKINQFQSSLGKKSLLTQKLRIQKKETNNIDMEIQDKSKNTRYIRDKEISFGFNSRSKQLKAQKVKPCVQCAIF